MGKPLSKEYQPEDERIATFRITHGKLTDFQKVCEEKGISLSQALIGFIDSVIDGGNIPSPASQVVAIPDNVPTKDDLESAITTLKAELMAEIEAVKEYEPVN